jgi:hypothetical protein
MVIILCVRTLALRLGHKVPTRVVPSLIIMQSQVQLIRVVITFLLVLRVDQCLVFGVTLQCRLQKGL